MSERVERLKQRPWGWQVNPLLGSKTTALCVGSLIYIIITKNRKLKKWMGWGTYGENDLVTMKVGSQRKGFFPSSLLPSSPPPCLPLAYLYYRIMHHEELYLVCLFLFLFYNIIITTIILIHVCILIRERKKDMDLSEWGNGEGPGRSWEKA